MYKRVFLWSSLVLAITVNSGFCSSETIFKGRPVVRINVGDTCEALNISCVASITNKLSAVDAEKFQCIIVKVDEKYYWATRGSTELIRTEFMPGFVTYYAVNDFASGFIRIISQKVKNGQLENWKLGIPGLMLPGFNRMEMKYDYLEVIFDGISTISYYGKIVK